MNGGDMFALLVMIAILGGITAFVVQPLMRRNTKGILVNYYEETPINELHARKSALYQSIKDVEFDFKTAKLSEQDYRGIRDKLEKEAVALLEEIDKAESRSNKKNLGSISKSAKKKTPGIKCRQCGEKNKQEAKFCVGCGSELIKVPLTCPSCGYKHKSNDKFCPGCGSVLAGN